MGKQLVHICIDHSNAVALKPSCSIVKSMTLFCDEFFDFAGKCCSLQGNFGVMGLNSMRQLQLTNNHQDYSDEWARAHLL
jgi:hypothetical protein